MSENYDLKSTTAAQIPAPVFPYQPPSLQGAAPIIGLIGCGGITEHHLKTYKASGWEAAAFYGANPDATHAWASCCAPSRKTANRKTPPQITSRASP